MDLMKWVKGQHKGIRWFYETTIASNTPAEKFKQRTYKNGNSIAWLMWHTARTEDFVVNTLIRDRPQILTDGWDRKLGIDELRIGTGFDDDEVTQLTDSIDVPALDEYWKAVADDTSAWLNVIDQSALDDRPDLVDRQSKAIDAFSVGPAALAMWQGKSAGFLLSGSVISHAYIHVGEMNAIRGQLGVGGYW